MRRIAEWFWRAGALARQRERFPEPDERSLLLARRARACADVARVALTPTDAAEIAGEGIAAELYRQSIYWSACARAKFGPDVTTEQAFATLDDAELSRVTKNAERRAALERALGGSFIESATLPRAEQLANCAELRALAELQLERLDEGTRAARAVHVQRAWRLGVLALILLALGGGALKWYGAYQLSRDLAVGKTWTASSNHNVGGCVSPAQECDTGSDFFFHTNEEDNPWIEFDLTRKRRVSSLVIENRLDCCLDRALPLVVEVSDDHTKWETVAENKEEFTSWRAAFKPTRVRWVRLSVPRHTYLHLMRVHIFS